MEKKTKVIAEEGRQDLLITREFDLPVELLYAAFSQPEMVEQWMGTKVLKLETQKHGSWQFETRNGEGNVVFSAHGTIHEASVNTRIVRTFEMDNASFGVQLECLAFEKVSEDQSRLQMHVIYESGERRDAMLKLPFAYGINIAHDRLQEVMSSQNTTVSESLSLTKS